MDSTKSLYWHFAASCCLVLFVILGYIAKFYEATLLYIDQPIANLIRQTITSGRTTFFVFFTEFGGNKALALLALLFVLFCWKKRYLIEALWLTINTGLIAGVGNYLIKFAFERARPDVTHLVTESHFSFPSGHAMGATLLYGTFILLMPNFIKNVKLRIILQGLLVLLIFLIGISRIYLGVHFPTDILGGYLLGSAWLLGTYPTFQKQRFILRFKGKQN